MKIRVFVLLGLVILLLGALAAVPLFNHYKQAQAAPEIYASPVQAGCYIATPNDCRIHVDPFTINLNTTPGTKLVQYSFVAIQLPSGIQTTIYDFRTDQSNPAPVGAVFSYSPSLVAQDFAATCGKNYEISLQGQDTADSSVYNLGLTRQFTCPTGVP
jgi:hypothetical protein